MPEDIVKIRVKTGESEAEVEASLANIREAIGLIPEVVSQLPRGVADNGVQPFRPRAVAVSPLAEEQQPASAPASSGQSMPIVTVEKGDSLSDVITKFFGDPWGRNPRKLMEVREALQSYGLNYPKQSVAVALLRLAKGSRIRRFKGEGGEYVYTASTGAVRIPTPVQPTAVQHPPTEGAPPVLDESEEPEEQLDLDAPAAN